MKNSKNGLVSVIIPCYNQGCFINDAVKSVLNSSYQNIEIIIVNDGSRDFLTNEVLKGFNDERIKVIHQANQGVCAARNNGIKEANGEFILPLDADDKIAPLYIEKAVKVLQQNPKIGIVYCDAQAFGVDNKKLNLKKFSIKNILIENLIFVSAIFRKEDFEKTEKFRNVMNAGCEDWDVWLSLIERGAQVYKIEEVLFFYRKYENTRTSSALKFKNYIQIRRTIISLHKALYKKHFLKVILPMSFLILKNGLFNVLNNTKGLRKFLRKIYYKTTIEILGLYPEIKRINRRKIDKEIKDFTVAPAPKRQAEAKIIISLTSIPERMHDIHYCLYSLISQSFQADKIILWLGEEKFPNKEKDLPQTVLKFKDWGVDIKFTKDIRSFTKLVPALREFPDDIIVTADDDIFYEKDWLKNLAETYEKHPQDIIVHKPLEVSLDTPYSKWKAPQTQSSFKNFILGVGGVLYPPNPLHKDTVKEDLFLNLCPHNDDVWFWAMAVKNNRKIRLADNSIPTQTIISIERELNLNNEPTLYKGNRICRTDLQFLNVLSYYKDIEEKLED